MKQKKDNFSSRLGFVLAAAGSAVGLGNLWRFPYLAAKYGGGSFLLIYLILAVTFGFALLTTEIALGRKTGKSALYAFGKLNEKWSFIGVLASAVPIIIMPYYCVIGGWVIKYAWVYIAGSGAAAAGDDFFTGFISQPVEPIAWLVVFILASMAIILLGVNKGIENMSKVLMPLLVVLSVVIAIFVITRPGATAGLVYYFKPDLSKMSANAFLAALGQLFYSMSLAMGIMITYGSYMKKEDDIEASVRNVEIFDTGIAFLAGLMIVPAVFVFNNGDTEALKAGPTLMFITLPKVFDSMAGGHIIGAVFFILVFFAALTSAISLMETVVSIFVEKTGKSRKFITICVTIYTILMAVPSSLGFGIWSHISIKGLSILDMWDFLSNSVLMPIVALLTCIFVGYVVKTNIVTDEVKASTDKFKSEKLYVVLIKYFSPILIVLILISSILNTFGIITL
ncbi:MAG: sodium-dependent transporter [Lachnospiraceae bacterium]|nr:sodium-dependent transporter [Lachnospiraceae bacterium]